ncbi:sigma-70 family RNA polymerase sigma factor [Streptomyces sp. NPDC006207]
MSSKSAERAEDLMDAQTTFHDVRNITFGIAYRMLGNIGDAEDVLQEAWIRWQTYDRSKVQNPDAFLTTMVTRLTINVLQSARVRRENYVGHRPPESIDPMSDPALGTEKAEALKVAVLMLMERLTPAERAAYVLREAFEYPYGQIAEVIGQSQVNVRQLVSRARKRLAAQKRASVSAADHQRFLVTFLVAARAGNVAPLERLFAEDVACPGGGVVRAEGQPRLRMGLLTRRPASA